MSSACTRPATQSAFQVSSFSAPDGSIRHILTHRASGQPRQAASLYEAHLILKTDSFNTRHREMTCFGAMYAWAEDTRVDLDRLLLIGQGLTPAQIRSFAAWLRAPKAQANGAIPHKRRRSLNLQLTTCAAICSWFVRQFANSCASPAQRAADVARVVSAQQRSWKEVRTKVRGDPVAPDLTEAEIRMIEQFLKPAARAKEVGAAVATRDYLMWRMAIEFGMRKSEILAMRMIDCPTRAAPYFKIVRIEERGAEYIDPRKNPPRPKTLSRDLGLIIDETVFPKLVSEYVTTHRFKLIERHGKKVKQFLLPHEFLIIARNGDPMSISAASDVAHAITVGTGVKFHWHLARHAFFNRAYAAVAEVQDRNEYNVKLGDLVHWGGWSNDKSLDIYTRRARADRARHALRLWQSEGSRWTALA